MKKSFLTFLTALSLMSSAQAQSWVVFPDMVRQRVSYREKLSVSLASGPMVFNDNKLGICSELGAMCPISEYFAFSLSGQWTYSHIRKPEDFGEHELMYTSVSGLIGLRYFPTGLQRRTSLSFGIAYGPGFVSGYERDIMYFDSGPMYSYQIQEQRVNKPLQGKRAFSDRAFSINYRYFLGPKTAIGVSLQHSRRYLVTARLTITRKLL